jgi:hypothetical protein
VEEKSCKIVRNAGVARKLLKMGCVIVDIKRDKEDETGKKSVFVFNKDTHFDEMFGKINDELNAIKTAE